MSSAHPAENNTPRKYQLFIGGQWVDAESGKNLYHTNPLQAKLSQKLPKPIRLISTKL